MENDGEQLAKQAVIGFGALLDEIAELNAYIDRLKALLSEEQVVSLSTFTVQTCTFS